MSGYLWKYYLEDDVDSFRHILENTAHNGRAGAQKSVAGWQGGLGAALNSSPGGYSSSPSASSKGRKSIAQPSVSLTRWDINSRDSAGMTILHHAASSSSENAIGFAQALLEHPLTDLYIQDAENGWTPLHRAFYFGNIAIARLIMNRDTQDILGHGSGGYNQHAKGLVKIKDKEGHGPLDLFSVTIKDRTLREDDTADHESDSDDELAHGDSGDRDDETHRHVMVPTDLLKGDEVFTFGSNKNVTLGFRDQDDRQFPERISLRRPDHLLQRFYREHLEERSRARNVPLHRSGNLTPKAIADLPIHIRNTPIVIQNVQMSKLHTAVITTDPVSNLYMCGHGPGGRLGTGSEITRYQFTCIEGGGLDQKKIATVALGQNHTLAITDEGETFSWGNNAYGQLGYSLPRPALKDDDPVSTLPRQIFGPLKRELITGIAASRIHSVAHTASSLYTFGKNEGQLGIVDSDARSLEMQITPRKVAASLFSSPILSVSAIDGATICLLDNREVWVFANYGYTKVNFPLDGFTNYFLKESWRATKYHATPNRIGKITSAGDTICALSTSGEVFTFTVSRPSEASLDANTSTTNPKQIRGALSPPRRIWAAKSGHMAARDVDVDQDGSIILVTEAGTVLRRTKRATLKNATAAGTGEHKSKEHKFQRVPGLTRVVAVRASAFGAYAAIRKDCDVTKTQIGVDESSLSADVAPLLSFGEIFSEEEPNPRFHQRHSKYQALRTRTLKSDLEDEVTDIIRRKSDDTYDMVLCTSVSDIRIPVHEFIISGRSKILREFMAEYRSRDGDLDVPDLLRITHQDDKLTVIFFGVDFLTIFNLVVYSYTDSVVDFWNATRQFPAMAARYRSVRAELMKVALRLELRQLEQAVRQMVNPIQSLSEDLEVAVQNSTFFDTGDVIIDLSDGERLLHSAILIRRCPFFEGIFQGRAGGQWLAGRRTEESPQLRIDLTHFEPHLFDLVVRHIYTDAGEEIFEDVTSEDLNDFLALDELLDHVMDVMAIANELMLDRLTQICQRLVGRYVNARNVCSLLNAIAPSSVVEFKDAALEYVCLSLEAVMQNSSLDELEDDLLLDLNEVVRDNQLATLPFAKSGRAEALLFDKYPELAERIDRGKRAKIDAIVLSNKFAEGEGFTTSSFRAQSLEEVSASPLRQRTRRKVSNAKAAMSPSVAPQLKDKGSVPDLMFEMSDGEDHGDQAETIPPPKFTEGPKKQSMQTPVGSLDTQWSNVVWKSGTPSQAPRHDEMTTPQKETRTPGQPWGDLPLGGDKLDLRDIMSQDTPVKPSNITLGLNQQTKREGSPGSFTAKMSQKERKRLQQAQQLGQSIEKPQPAPPAMSPWQASPHRKPTPAITPSSSPAVDARPPAPRASSSAQLTMRQTIAKSGPASKQKGKQAAKSVSSDAHPSPIRPPADGPGMSVDTTPIPTPHSVRHIPLPSHSPSSPSQHLTLEEILSAQQAEKILIRDAAAARSLQEIQQEQEFQQWWDQESKRAILEEEQRQRAEERAARGGRSRGRIGRNKGKGRDKKGTGEATGASASSVVAEGAPKTTPKTKPRTATDGAPTAAPKQGADERGRGRGKGPRGRGGGGRGGRGQGPARGLSATAEPFSMSGAAP